MKHKVVINNSGVNPIFLKSMDKVAPIFIVFMILALIAPGSLLSYSGWIYYQQHRNSKAVNGQVAHHEHGSENAHHDKKIALSKDTHGCPQNPEGDYIGKLCSESILPALLGFFLIFVGLCISIMLFLTKKS